MSEFMGHQNSADHRPTSDYTAYCLNCCETCHYDTPCICCALPMYEYRVAELEAERDPLAVENKILRDVVARAHRAADTFGARIEGGAQRALRDAAFWYPANPDNRSTEPSDIFDPAETTIWNVGQDDPHDHYPWRWEAYLDVHGGPEFGTIYTPTGRRPDGTMHTYRGIVHDVWEPQARLICFVVNEWAHARFGTPIPDEDEAAAWFRFATADPDNRSEP